MLKTTFTTKNIALMGLLIAMSAALAPLTTMIAPNQKFLSLYFIPLAVGAAVLGPVAALLMGLAADTINYLIKPMGAYFPGFALSLMLSCLIYALWQYKKPLRLWRLVCAQLCNIALIYFALNFVWMTMLYGTTASKFYSVTRIFSNSIQFPFIVLSVYALSKTALALMKRKNI